MTLEESADAAAEVADVEVAEMADVAVVEVADASDLLDAPELDDTYEDELEDDWDELELEETGSLSFRLMKSPIFVWAKLSRAGAMSSRMNVLKFSTFPAFSGSFLVGSLLK